MQMMVQLKSAILAFGLVTVACTSPLCFAQASSAVSNPSALPSKIAFVNLQEAVVTCNEGKQESAALEKKFSAKSAALKSQDDELKKLKDDYQVVNAKLNDDERNSRLKVIQDKQKIFERSYADYQSETQEAQQEAINKIMKKMLPVLEKYLLANGYTAVMDVSGQQTQVIWVRKEALITQQLVNAYNTEGSAPATPSGAAPSKPGSK